MIITPEMTIEEALQQAKAEEYGAKELVEIARRCYENGLIEFKHYSKVCMRNNQLPF